MNTTKKLLKKAEVRADKPAGHHLRCSCPECIAAEARAEVATEGVIARVAESYREEDRQDAERERWFGEQDAARTEHREATALSDKIRLGLGRGGDSVKFHLERALSSGDHKLATSELTRAAQMAAVNRELRREQKREAKRSEKARVKAEPRVYGPKSPQSYYMDLAARAAEPTELAGVEASRRMARYEEELAYEVGRRSPEGKRAVRMIREATRSERPDVHRQAFEARALTTGAGATATASSGAAAFVSPYFATSLWAPYRGIARPFADSCAKEPLPPWGLEVDIPAFTSTDKVAKQTEGAAVTETVPAASLEKAKVETLAGQVLVSQQLFERADTRGGRFDVVMGLQLQQQLDQEIDLYTINAAIANGEAVTGQATYSTKNLYQDLALAREKLTDTAGTRLRPTHLFTTSDIYSYATRQVDASTERPIITPQYAPGFPITMGADDFDGGPKPPWSRFTGTILPGGVLWFEDDNIPAVGTTNRQQLIVSAPATAIVLFEGESTLQTFAETYANELRVVVTLRAYVTAVTRHASGTAIVSSAAYTSALI